MPCQIFPCHAVPGTRILVPRSRSWYQDLGTKKNGELERRSLSKIERGGAGGCRPHARGFGELEALEQQGVPVKTILWHDFPCHAVPLVFRANIFRAVPCQDFPCQDFLGRAPAINLRVHGSVPCHGVPVSRGGKAQRGLKRWSRTQHMVKDWNLEIQESGNPGIWK